MIVSRDFFDAVGGFDDRYFLYFEDVDLCRKAREQGLTVVFDPSFEVTHRAEHESSRLRGISRSIINNITARHHILSWIRYCIKWRQDFLSKAKILANQLSRIREIKLKISTH